MKNVILGLNGNHADSSACIIIDNKIEAAIEEERINRIKHWAGTPFESINFCLEHTNLKLNDINYIAINSSPLSNLNKKIVYFLKNYMFGDKKYEIYQRLKKKISLKNSINKFFKNQQLNKNIKFHFHDHHKCHLASAFYPSKFDKAIGLSIDGFGDFCSLAIAKCYNNKIQIIDKVYFPNSLGLFYEAITQFIGFKKYGDEYKIMGLSSYGDPIYESLIKNNLFCGNEKLILNLKYFNHTKKDFKYKFEGMPIQNNILNDEFKKLFNQKDIENFEQFQKNIASSCQKVFESFLNHILIRISNLNFSKNLVYAGGCALNSLANKQIIENSNFKNIFIPYAPGDNGGSIGAALLTNKKINSSSPIKNTQSPYLGPVYSNGIINDFIISNDLDKNYNVKFYDNKKNLHVNLAQSIYENLVVGYFSGRMEFGARALGSRSILANPGNKNVKDLLNLKIKRRENFRPFAPAILEDKKKEWFSTNFFNPYMSCVENIRKEKRNIIPGVTHVDGTGRVQSVSKNINEFYKVSGLPILLNTSFNENEPIVMSPQHAIDCFLRTNMDILVLENYIVSRKS